MPATGYEVEKWTVNGTAVANNTTNEYSHKVTANTEVKVLFKASGVAVTGVTLNKNELTLEKGKSEKLTATVNPTNATNTKVTWSSDNEAVAAVDENGMVTAKKVGTAKITVTTADGNKTADCTVTVTPPKYQISFSVEGGNGTLKATADGVAETETSPITVEHGKTVTFTATPSSGYEVKTWTNNGEPIAAAGTNNTYTHTVTKAADIRVSFTRTIYTVNEISFTMKKIAAVTGKSVGHPDIVGYTGANDNKPHSISLSAYLIGETEVTQELWQAVMGDNPSWFKGSSNPPDGDEEQGKRPVENINWYHAIAFCNKLSIACGLELCYTVSGVNFATLHFNNIPKWDDGTWNNAVCDLNKNGFRLPTEAEWEWAAMGGTEHKWAGTNDKNELGTYAWYEANSNDKTHQVKLKSPNGYGLYDMTGNVGEWCWDWYGSLSDVLPPNYTGAASGNMRVTRGGSWSANENYALRAYRSPVKPDENYRIGGLRVVSRP